MTTAPQSLHEEAAEFAAAWNVPIDVALEKCAERRQRATELTETTDPEVLHPAIRDALKLRAKIERIVKTTSTPAHFRIETDAGTVALGPPTRWATRPAEFSAAFLDIGEMPTLPTGPRRNELCTMIARAAEPEDIGEEATDAGYIRALTNQYLAQRPPLDDPREALNCEYPYIDAGGQVCIFSHHFHRWLLITHQTRLTGTNFGRLMKSIGWHPEKYSYTPPGAKRTSTGIWREPAAVFGGE